MKYCSRSNRALFPLEYSENEGSSTFRWPHHQCSRSTPKLRLQDFGSLTTFDGSAGRNLGDTWRIATFNSLYCDIVTDCALLPFRLPIIW